MCAHLCVTVLFGLLAHLISAKRSVTNISYHQICSTGTQFWWIRLKKFILICSLKSNRESAVELIMGICPKVGIVCIDLLSAFGGSLHAPDFANGHLDWEMFIFCCLTLEYFHNCRPELLPRLYYIRWFDNPWTSVFIHKEHDPSGVE